MYKVLLVDDEAWILEGLKAMIDWEGEGFCICATASNGLEAESLVREQQPDFILADIRMPGCDGLALLGRLRQAGCNALYAIISGYAEFSYAQECIKLGACGYLLKPVEEEELLSLLRCVRQTLGQRYEKRIMEELEQETGLVETLFPRQCYLAVVYGGERFTPAIPALCARLSRRSRLYLSEQPLRAPVWARRAIARETAPSPPRWPPAAKPLGRDLCSRKSASFSRRICRPRR